MQDKILSFLLLLIFLFGCEKKNSPKAYLINPNNFINNRISISDIAENIQYIPLSDTFPISNIFKLEKHNNLFFTTINANNELVVFDTNGQYQNDIGKVGRGPDEYSRATKFAVDKNNKTILILDRNRLLFYTFRGKMIKSYNLDIFETNFDDIEFFNDKIYLFEGISYGEAKYDWIVLDKNGKCIFKKENNIDSFESTFDFGNSLSMLENKIHYMNLYNDTIFEIVDTLYSPAYIFESGEFRVPTKPINPSGMRNIFITAFFTESKSHFFMFATYINKQILCYHNRHKDNFYIVDEHNIQIGELLNPGIVNDIDNGPKFSPLFYFKENGFEYFVDWIFPYKLKAHVASENFKKSNPQYPEKKKELEKLANSLDDNDNPVLMLVKLKE